MLVNEVLSWGEETDFIRTAEEHKKEIVMAICEEKRIDPKDISSLPFHTELESERVKESVRKLRSLLLSHIPVGKLR